MTFSSARLYRALSGVLTPFLLACMMWLGSQTQAPAQEDAVARGLAASAGSVASQALPLAQKPAPWGVTNPDPFNLPHWRLALGNVMQGVSNAKIICMCDSDWSGWGGGTNYTTDTAGTTGAWVTGQAFQLCQQLGVKGIPCRADSITGLAGSASVPQYLAYNPYVTLSNATDWPRGSNAFGLGTAFTSNVPNATLTYQPPPVTGTSTALPYDSVLIEYYNFNAPTLPAYPGTCAPFTVSDASGTLATLCATPPALNVATMAVATVTRPRNSGPITITNNGTTSSQWVFITAIIPYDSTTKSVLMINSAQGGATAFQWAQTANPWSPYQVVKFLAPDLTVIHNGANDLAAGTVAATVSGYWATELTIARLSSGSVIFSEYQPLDGYSPTNWTALQPSYQQAFSATVGTTIPFVNQTAMLQSESLSHTYYWTDNVHLNLASRYVMMKHYADLIGATF